MQLPSRRSNDTALLGEGSLVLDASEDSAIGAQRRQPKATLFASLYHAQIFFGLIVAGGAAFLLDQHRLGQDSLSLKNLRQS